jgi:GH15 family glucan-1,4-alpha-glucosidase
LCAILERICSFANDVGLLSEQIDPESGELLGNFPQGFIHAGLIRAALHLQEATQ